MTTNGPHDQNHDSPGDWQPCPQGELGQLVGRLRSRQRNVQIRRATQTSLMAAGVFAAAVACFMLWPSDPAPGRNPGGITQPVARISCGEVRKRTEEFVKGKVDEETKLRIENHLGKCGSCANYVREHRPTAILTQPAH